jgi:hypothetical protein
MSNLKALRQYTAIDHESIMDLATTLVRISTELNLAAAKAEEAARISRFEANCATATARKVRGMVTSSLARARRAK